MSSLWPWAEAKCGKDLLFWESSRRFPDRVQNMRMLDNILRYGMATQVPEIPMKFVDNKKAKMALLVDVKNRRKLYEVLYNKSNKHVVTIMNNFGPLYIKDKCLNMIGQEILGDGDFLWIYGMQKVLFEYQLRHRYVIIPWKTKRCQKCKISKRKLSKMNGNKKLRLCKGCKCTFHCSIKCQKIHWNSTHKYFCLNRNECKH